MTLQAKILLKMGALLFCFGLLGSFAVWGFASLRANNGATQREFRELQEIRDISVRLATDKSVLEEGPPRRTELASDLDHIVNKIRLFVHEQKSEVEQDNTPAERLHDALEREHAENAIRYVRQMQASLARPDAFEPASLTQLRNLHNHASIELDAVVGECAKFLHSVHSTTRATLRVVLAAMCALSVAVLAVAIGVGISLYRSIVHPLQELNEGVREMAAGHFAARLPERGDPEFRAVIREFNTMASQLQEFYLRLEERVAQKSRELVRSERLASVGFLAAGVAHEIRNPLGIISGYAELSLKMLDGAEAPADEASRERRILRVIRDEAFRCKKITDKLLGLVQGGGDGREPVDVCQVVRDVVFLVKGLESFRERRAEICSHLPDSLCASVNPIEMKQVVLNLTLNALDALEVGSGKIEIEGRRVNGRIELSVRDNGCGIGPDSLEQVFEPFYTSKRGCTEPGTGLGLSISHAIISQYGGIIRAESQGAGRGSRFTIELPAAQEAKS